MHKNQFVDESERVGVIKNDKKRTYKNCTMLDFANKQYYSLQNFEP